ncbi:MAG TPA: hypothetical protein VJU78_05260 [Chitinophagaceae bacterium]|nr:hypothetical protein [Chitinophagaceae bacterium]
MKIIDTIIKLSTSTIQADWELAYEYASKLSHFEKLDLKYELKANAHIIQSGAKTRLASFYR